MLDAQESARDLMRVGRLLNDPRSRDSVYGC